MLQSSNPNFRSLDLSLGTPTPTTPTSSEVPAAPASATASLSGSTLQFGPEDPEEGFPTAATGGGGGGSQSLTPLDAREVLTRPTRAYASVSQPQSPRHRGSGSGSVSGSRIITQGLTGRSTSISSQLEKTKKLLKMTEGEDKPLIILHYNDVYNIESMAETEPVGGAARFATAIKSFAHLNPLVLFSGDAFSPSMC